MCRWSLDESATTELTALLTKSKLEITIKIPCKMFLPLHFSTKNGETLKSRYRTKPYTEVMTSAEACQD